MRWGALFLQGGWESNIQRSLQIKLLHSCPPPLPIRLFPERITPGALSTHQVQHCLMKSSAAPSAMAFRKTLSLQKYKLVLVLTIEMDGTALPNKFICIEVCRTDLSGYNEGQSRTPFEPRQCMFNIPPEPCLTGRDGPAHTLFPLSRTQKLERVNANANNCYLQFTQKLWGMYGCALIQRQTTNNFLHLQSIAGWFSLLGCFLF